jgi:cytochrome c oxidase cbb3-type subunit III
MKRFVLISLVLLLGAATVTVFGAQRGQRSPAAVQPPSTLTPQFYTSGQVAFGEGRFVARCGFCHGRDAAGGEGDGPDLTRSDFVSEDVYGNKIGPLVRNGIPSAGMPAFDIDDNELGAIVAFIHDEKARAEAAQGGRRSVEPEDLRTGDAEAGLAWFNGEGGCTACHSATGDLAGVASRLEGLTLLQRMLYPSGGRGGGPQTRVRVTESNGNVVTGTLRSENEFSITMTDTNGQQRTWNAGDVRFEVDDPLDAHFRLLGRYTDTEMHNVYAYLETLR